MSSKLLRNTLVLFFCLALSGWASTAEPRPEGKTLSGLWAVSEEPVALDANLDRLLKAGLPGSLAQMGFGDEVTIDSKWIGQIVDQSYFTDDRYASYREPGNIRVPFWLTPVKHTVGYRWFTRDIEIPEDWADRYMSLFLERCHWETEVWLDGQSLMGSQNSLSTPHEYILGKLSPGKHRLAIKVDNTPKIDVGENAHSVSDHTQTAWLGIIGDIDLRPLDEVRIDDLQIYPDVKGKIAKTRVRLSRMVADSPKDFSANLILEVRSGNGEMMNPPITQKISAQDLDKEVGIAYPMKVDCMLWSEFQPFYYTMTARLEWTSDSEKARTAEKRVIFGMREFTAKGTRFYMNDRPVFLRGTLECAIFPKTGFPPTGVNSWIRILRTAREHGLNHLRFHSWCPPEEAFEAADKWGFIFHIECDAWATIGDGESVDKFIYEEGDRILKAYGNHPSFCMMAYGNEPGGKNQKRWLGDLVNYWKKKDPRRLYTSAAGWPMIPENQYHISPDPRVQAWGAGSSSRINARPPETMTDYRDYIAKWDVPIVSHEIGQWCVFPNFDEIKKYTGVTRAGNFEIFRDFLDKNHMLDQAHDFLMASGKLQVLCYKEDIESAMRTNGFGGFELLDLHDFPGQGSALVGVLDAFWDSKPYVTPEEYHRFACETVPLARMEKRIWTSDETFHADVEMFHFGKNPLGNKVLWRVRNDAKNVVANGIFPEKIIPLGQGIEMGSVNVDLSAFDRATKLNLEVLVDGTDYANDWDFWVYPKTIDTAAAQDVLIASELDDAAMAALQKGGKVLLIPGPGRVKGDQYGKVPAGFSTIFWNTAWTHRQAPHTMGILCDPQTPALAGFPTEYHTNWQWWDIINKSQIMILQNFPPQFRPTVQVIDTWFDSRKLGLIFEAKVNGGQLLICGADLVSDLDSRPVARQMRHSLLKYMAGAGFNPKNEIPLETIKDLFTPPPAMAKYGGKVINVDSAAKGYEGENAIDGDPSTCWHTAWDEGAPDFPHELVIQFDQPVAMKGLVLTPRQDMKNGWFTEYAVYVSDNPEQWGDPVFKGSLPADKETKTISFEKNSQGQYLRLTPLKSYNGDIFASLGELEIIVVE